MPDDVEGARTRLQQLRQHEEVAGHWGGVVETGLDTPSEQAPFTTGCITPLIVDQVQELRPMRQMLEQGVQGGADILLVVVQAEAAQSMCPLRDLAQLLGHG